MPELSISVESAGPVAFAAAPTLAFKLRVGNFPPHETVHAVMLSCQLQIEVTRRRYSPTEQEQLRDLFGEPERWSSTLRNLHWMNASALVPQFTGSTTADLQAPCTFDFNIAVTKYFGGLEAGEIPVCLMFSGTVFYADAGGLLKVAPIPWDKEAHFRLPMSVWKDMMDRYYPNTAWLNLRRDVFEELNRFKRERGIPTWEQTFEAMLSAMKEEAVPR